jgi:diacylglycerol O-acyltransferase
MSPNPNRLSALDTTFLDLEDAVSHMHIGSVGIFEGPAPPQDELVAKIAAKLPLVPRYRQVVRRVPGNVGRPVWVDDPHFHIDYHVRRTALPTPGGEPELRRLVGRLMSQQLDRNKPLWEMWIVEGLDDGRWASITKAHHCLVDGVSGTELLAVLMDLSPDVEPLPKPQAWLPHREPTSVELLARTVLDLARSPVEQVSAVRGAGLAFTQAVVGSAQLAKGFASLAGLIAPTEASSLNGPIGPHRRWAWASATVDDVKTVRQALGGTFNDVVLAVITAGFRALLRSRGEPTDRLLRTMVPVSVRGRDTSGRAIGDQTFNNKVSAMFAELPVDIVDPVEQLHAITEQMDGLKESSEAMAAEALTSLAGFAPPMLLGLGLRIASRVPQRNFNTVTTNVPGPQLPLYMLGRRMLKAYPYVPLWGRIRITVAIFSYDGQVNFGVTGDYDTASDIAVICRGIERGLKDLLRAAQPAPQSPRRAHERKRSANGSAPRRAARTAQPRAR